MSMQSNVPNWANVETPQGDRTLPVYLLLDSSTSMEGAPIQSVKNGLELFQREVSTDQFAREVVKVGIITFGSEARLLTDGLVPIADFTVPDLVASGVTRLDLAFNVLLDSMERHVVKAVKSNPQGEGGRKGDYKPAVFILTDGQPTDENGYAADHLWQAAKERVVKRPTGYIKPSTIVTVGCGTNVDKTTLKNISTGAAFLMSDDDASFTRLFQYLSQSITASVSPGGNPDDPFAGMPSSSDTFLDRIP